VNGSGNILGSDVTLVRNRQGTSLPAGDPPMLVAEGSFAWRRLLGTASG
jgi:hypothetical protein